MTALADISRSTPCSDAQRKARFHDLVKTAGVCFSVSPCSLGAILVAASERGICAIALADEEQALTQALLDRFPKAQQIEGDALFEGWMRKVIRFVEQPRGHFELPLDIRGTAFQQRVWQALCQIPAGTTASYSQIATQIGSPKSVRAVASACAANVLAVVIPCHRVVRSDGALSGYRWGIERKRKLLARERM